jgi:hypothetical protein
MNDRWYILTPGKLVGGLLVVELALLAIDRRSGWLCLAGVGALVLVVFLGLLWFVAALFLQRKLPLWTLALVGLPVVVAIAGGWLSWKVGKAGAQQEAVDPFPSPGGVVPDPCASLGPFTEYDSMRVELIAGHGFLPVIAGPSVGILVLVVLIGGLFWFIIGLLHRRRFRLGEGTWTLGIGPLLLVIAIVEIAGGIAGLSLAVVVAVVVGLTLSAVVVGLTLFGISLLLRQPFQFGIRTLLTLMVVVAVVGGWFSWKWEMAKKQMAIVEEVSQLRPKTPTTRYDPCGCSVFYDYQYDEKGNLAKHKSRPNPPESPCDHLFCEPMGLCAHGRGFRDVDLARLTALVRQFTSLRQLQLYCPKLTDAGMEHLAGLPQLRRLSLSRTQVTDAGLEHVKELTQLESLDLYGTQVTDAGLKHLKKLTQLSQLNLSRTRVTDEGVRHLEQALPSCQICR